MDFIAQYNQHNQFGKENNLELEVLDKGHITYTMQLENKHLALPDVVHGGVLAGLMDALLSVAAFSSVADEGLHVATVEFKINYLKAVKRAVKIKGEGKVIKKGKRFIICEGQIFDDHGEIVAIGTGTIVPFQKNQ